MSSWINRAELKFGRLAIPGLLRYVAALNALSFILYKLNPGYLEFLFLDRDAVLRGEVWRLVTFLFVPGFGWLFPDWFGMAFYIVFLMWIGDGLEHAWGPFRVTLYYLLGLLGTTIGVFIAGGDPRGFDSSGFILNSALLFAFARFYPDTIIRILFVLPVKVKWLAWIEGAQLLLLFLGGLWSTRAAILIALGNYLLFFGRDLAHEARSHREIARRRAKFVSDMRDGLEETVHRCKICERTEVSAPDLEFRVAADGDEYCVEHLPKAATPS